MNRKKNDIDHRRKALLEMIRQAKGEHLNIDQIASLMGISPVTLRRDLVALQEQGLSLKDACRQAAAETGFSKNALYRRALDG